MLRNVTVNLQVLSFVFLITAFSCLAQGSSRKCWIKSMVGDVKIQRKKSPKWLKARPNMTLKENDAVRTFVESEAVLQTSEGSNIALGENTTLELSAFSISGKGATKTGIKILSGNLMANIKKLVNKKSKFEFETPTAVAAIRGTRVGFEVEKTKTSIKVYEGKVYVVPKGARKGAELQANQMSIIVKGQKKIVIEKMTEKEDESTRSLSTDTLEETTDTTFDDTTALADTTEDVRLVLNVFSPENGQIIIPGSQIIVSGKVTPADADVRVRGTVVPVSPNGEFRRVLKGLAVEGEHDIKVEAVYKDLSKTITRHFIVKSIPVELKLIINEPANKLVINKPLIRVSGIVTPGAEVSVSGIDIPVSSNGNFTRDIPIPDEEGEFVVEIEAILNEETKTETRTVIYKPLEEDISIIVQLPADKQIICDNRKVQVKGIVRPTSIDEISVNGLEFPVRNGIFADYIMLSDEQGEHEIEFEVIREDKSKTVRRIVRFEPVDKKCNTDAPYIQPTYLPTGSKNNRLIFTVYDKTHFDELTVYTSVDGSKDSETGSPGSRFYLELEEGIHTYEIYAEDLCGNISRKVTGTVSHLARDLVIRLDNPSAPYHLLHIPPTTPEGGFRPEFTVEFSVENLPDDDPKLLKEVKVLNKTTGDIESQKKFTNDIDFEFDIELKRGQNQLTIEVRDINDKLTTKGLVIEIR